MWMVTSYYLSSVFTETHLLIDSLMDQRSYQSFIARTVEKGSYYDLFIYLKKKRYFALFEEDLNRNGIDDQNNVDINDEPKDILEDDDDNNNEVVHISCPL